MLSASNSADGSAFFKTDLQAQADQIQCRVAAILL
jgi:hypothetical protein